MFRNTFKKIAVRYGMTRPAPNNIPLSFPRAADNDFFSVDLYRADGDRRLWATGATKDEVSGVSWENGNSRDDVIRFESEDFKSAEVVVTYYYRGFEFSFRHGLWLIAFDLLHIAKLWVLLKSAQQGVFNSKELVMYERMELLRWMVNRSIDDRGVALSALSIATELNSNRWFFHPGRRRHQNYIGLMLESLESSGDLQRDNHGLFKVSPQALASLDEYERAAQSHSDSISVARTANRLALLVLIVTAIGVIIEALKAD
ncbi:hypothetical protein [Aquipseudomonas alcaligenes]|uniref:Uncharacterized protein n=1 Tax=Aquipseudomonas alcaligenes TaxID=43263 RepID=A0AB73HTP7_AQUAC|nr:hypothetical protein [Pseudomonas alcaligenes]MDH0141144.1 hypothetical protein [Pseudomonas alcaligenes]